MSEVLNQGLEKCLLFKEFLLVIKFITRSSITPCILQFKMVVEQQAAGYEIYIFM
jgi:hypothetical protein